MQIFPGHILLKKPALAYNLGDNLFYWIVNSRPQNKYKSSNIYHQKNLNYGQFTKKCAKKWKISFVRSQIKVRNLLSKVWPKIKTSMLSKKNFFPQNFTQRTTSQRSCKLTKKNYENEKIEKNWQEAKAEKI